MRHVLLAGIALSAALAPAVPLVAQTATALSPAQTAQGELAVTIYNNNRALIVTSARSTFHRGAAARSFATSRRKSSPRPSA